MITCVCPTCGSTYEASLPRVDLGRNILITVAGHTKLQPREAEILTVLIDRFPAVVSVDDLIFALFGYSEETSDPWNLLRVYISRLRRILEPLGWTIPRASRYSRGYYLRKIGDTADG